MNLPRMAPVSETSLTVPVSRLPILYLASRASLSLETHLYHRVFHKGCFLEQSKINRHSLQETLIFIKNIEWRKADSCGPEFVYCDDALLLTFVQILPESCQGFADLMYRCFVFRRFSITSCKSMCKLSTIHYSFLFGTQTISQG